MSKAKDGSKGGRKPAYRRIMLKLSGEMLGGAAGKGLETSRLKGICSQVLEVAELGVEIAMVIGGGNVIRGQKASQESGLLHRATADYMGMLATMINALALQDALESLGGQTRVMSAIEARAVAEPYIRRRALRHLEKKRIVILAGGTGHPYFSTDTTAALRGMELDVQVLMKATKVDGVYDLDPKTHRNAKRFKRLSHMDVIRKRLGVMDMTAISLCMDNKLPIFVFSLEQKGNILRAVTGEAEKIGTLVG
ncbi:MAG: UMP kinase [Planctomycetota bacterium]|nr:UMP kinase [Planctomycetota bacterium]